MDVTSLYANIPQDVALIQCAQHTTIFTKKAPPMPTRYLPRTQKNSFRFNSKHYLQIHGTAMGTKTADTAVSFANIYMAKIETEILRKLQPGNGTYPTYLPCGIFLNQTLRLSLSKQILITLLSNSRQKSLTLSLDSWIQLYAKA